jgi:hypothetical protein
MDKMRLRYETMHMLLEDMQQGKRWRIPKAGLYDNDEDIWLPPELGKMMAMMASMLW